MNNSENLSEKYLESLTPKEKHAYEIAKNHLGSTFHLIKSNGFIQWKKKINVASTSLPSSS
jgi:hypothetical protein